VGVFSVNHVVLRPLGLWDRFFFFATFLSPIPPFPVKTANKLHATDNASQSTWENTHTSNWVHEWKRKLSFPNAQRFCFVLVMKTTICGRRDKKEDVQIQRMICDVNFAMAAAAAAIAREGTK